ncbi:LysM peptidoglycan-binding domain-containing protein [Shouchella patagoniensis]|uniref:LysM peptidoglycan-binding domain-containing protein n=1 Tax=Shouchella patagoniensis TaxID=228576 RepID=UPI001472F087|nr:SafA/ExsA family spore coat assembly protein [Shouchella patagoniensis]
MRIHIVQKGDTLWKLANKYDVEPEQIQSANPNVVNPEMLMPGMKLKVPTGTVVVRKEKTETNKQLTSQKQKETIPKKESVQPLKKSEIKAQEIKKTKPEIQMPSPPQSNKKGPTFEQQKPMQQSNELLPLPPKPPCAPCQGKQQSFSMPTNGGFAQQNAQVQQWMQSPPPNANMQPMQMTNQQQGNYQQYDPYSVKQQPSFNGDHNYNHNFSQNNPFMPNQQEFNPYQQNNTHQNQQFTFPQQHQQQQYMPNQQPNYAAQSNWPAMPMDSSQAETGFASQNMNNYGTQPQEHNYHQQNLLYGQSNQGYQSQQMNMPMHQHQQSFNSQAQIPQQQSYSMVHNQAPRMMTHNAMYQQGMNSIEPMMQEYEPRQQVNAYEEKDSQE